MREDGGEGNALLPTTENRKKNQSLARIGDRLIKVVDQWELAGWS